MTIDEQERRIESEMARAARLRDFIKGELGSMYVGARMQFTIDLCTYLEPEIRVLLKEKKIDVPEDYS